MIIIFIFDKKYKTNKLNIHFFKIIPLLAFYYKLIPDFFEEINLILEVIKLIYKWVLKIFYFLNYFNFV